MEGHELPVCILSVELLLNSGPREPAAPRHIGNLTLLLLLLFPFWPDGAAIHQLLSRNLGSSLSSPKQSPNPILLSLVSLSHSSISLRKPPTPTSVGSTCYTFSGYPKNTLVFLGTLIPKCKNTLVFLGTLIPKCKNTLVFLPFITSSAVTFTCLC